MKDMKEDISNKIEPPTSPSKIKKKTNISKLPSVGSRQENNNSLISQKSLTKSIN
jgi:hypothetical protein